ncbi:hypothetical protein PN497_05870 [Sphaerospermopsis kisseleviana CS-549]|uniref:CHAT domain-containing protein n=2 Tax=Sphaerospermopsis TaxID=752201 RepID=A0ABR9VDA2_9CYAN|nr:MULTISPECIES: hypothetical protein [Sphaerospermopsis]MBD2144289.1 hypothetical protein [Sphaerospermopsis sp. FACHB-1194]MBE9236466.1 hypothetical protein [Sphaerospermopsis aphanizomenoides LEGE 00250]MDB9440892.1 hypothetical protein [Sphaerospermopsis kisseleviana CS-549]BAZ81671.1 hypothetical protein NIES73_29390 [Sphaerospermopsis kisseleviana NIES-73]
MDEAKKQAYFELINKLLNSSRGEEPEILDNNKHLIDIDLVQTIKQIAAGMGAHGEEDNAKYLEYDREYQKYQKLAYQIYQIKTYNHQCPFSHPVYWAAFICHGLK